VTPTLPHPAKSEADAEKAIKVNKRLFFFMAKILCHFLFWGNKRIVVTKRRQEIERKIKKFRALKSAVLSPIMPKKCQLFTFLKRPGVNHARFFYPIFVAFTFNL
jgi:hypothetical protein